VCLHLPINASGVLVGLNISHSFGHCTRVYHAWDNDTICKHTRTRTHMHTHARAPTQMNPNARRDVRKACITILTFFLLLFVLTFFLKCQKGLYHYLYFGMCIFPFFVTFFLRVSNRLVPLILFFGCITTGFFDFFFLRVTKACITSTHCIFWCIIPFFF